MTILTNLPVNSICGTPEVVTIDKAQVVTDFAIVDAFWADPLNWQEIEFYYTNSVDSSQIKKMSFAGNTYSLNLKSNINNGDMLCQKITIMDGNGANLVFDRASFPVASEFDFEVSGGFGPFIPSAVAPFSTVWRDVGNSVLSNSDYTCTDTSAPSVQRLAYADLALPMTMGKYYKEFSLDVNPLFVNFKNFSIKFQNAAPVDFVNSLVAATDCQFQFYYDGGAGGVYKSVGVNNLQLLLAGNPVVQVGDRIGIALDYDSPTKDLYISFNGVWINGGNPLTGAGKFELNTIFPGQLIGLDTYFPIEFLSGKVWSQQSIPLYTPAGFTNV